MQQKLSSALGKDGVDSFGHHLECCPHFPQAELLLPQVLWAPARAPLKHLLQKLFGSGDAKQQNPSSFVGITLTPSSLLRFVLTLSSLVGFALHHVALPPQERQASADGPQ